MTKRDFFVLIIKLFGLYWLVMTFFTQIPSTISYIAIDSSWTFLIYTIAIYAFILSIFIFLIFQSEKIVKLLQLERGFDDERIDLGKADNTQIAKVGVFIIGGILFVKNAGYLIHDTINAFYWDINGLEIDEDYKTNWFLSAINIAIGLILITNYHNISNLLNRKKIRNEE